MSAFTIRPITPADDAAVAAIIRTVMPEFGASGDGFAINDPEVDWMHRAYSAPRGADGDLPGRGARLRLRALLPGDAARHGRGHAAVREERLHPPPRPHGRDRARRLQCLLHPAAREDVGAAGQTFVSCE